MFSLKKSLFLAVLAVAVARPAARLGLQMASAAFSQASSTVTVDEVAAASLTNPVDDDCPVGVPCKVKGSLTVNDAAQPASSPTAIFPGAFQFPSGASVVNGHIVGNVHANVHAVVLG